MTFYRQKLIIWAGKYILSTEKNETMKIMDNFSDMLSLETFFLYMKLHCRKHGGPIKLFTNCSDNVLPLGNLPLLFQWRRSGAINKLALYFFSAVFSLSLFLFCLTLPLLPLSSMLSKA